MGLRVPHVAGSGAVGRVFEVVGSVAIVMLIVVMVFDLVQSVGETRFVVDLKTWGVIKNE